jgi:hypothetical protein
MQATHLSPSTLLTNAQSRIVGRYAKTHDVSAKEASAAWKELIKFLELCGSTHESLAPSEIIDQMWHEAILHTRDYGVLCRAVARRFVHHVPSDGTDDAAYRRTLELLAENYGDVDMRFWPTLESVSADCSGGDDSPCSNCGSKCTDSEC